MEQTSIEYGPDGCMLCCAPVSGPNVICKGRIGIQLALVDDLMIVCLKCVKKMSRRTQLQQLGGNLASCWI